MWLLEKITSSDFRAIEWQSAIIMLGMGIVCVISPDSLEKGAFRYLIVLGFSNMSFAIFVTVIGVVRLWALIMNGRNRRVTARVRALAALGACGMWALMTIALFILTRDTVILSLGIPGWATISLFELVTCYRAGKDVEPRTKWMQENVRVDVAEHG